MSHDRISTQDAAEEAQIASRGLKAPRITPADIEAAIASEHYFTARHGVLGELASDGVPPTAYEQTNVPAAFAFVTICVLILRNGTKIVGVNTGPVSPENFDPELGRQYARQQAVDQVWPLLGYALRERIASGGARGL